MTTDGKRIIMSDGTAELRFWDPETLKETGRITVTDDGRPVARAQRTGMGQGRDLRQRLEDRPDRAHRPRQPAKWSAGSIAPAC